MRHTTKTTAVIIALVASLALGLGGCCCENNGDGCGPLKLHPIFQAAINGAIVGGIVGYQSHEEGEGAAIGAGLFVVGELLSQSDKDQRDRDHKHEDRSPESVVVEIHNDNGSITPVRLKKKDGSYIGPKGERYEELPTEEQLKPLYGL